MSVHRRKAFLLRIHIGCLCNEGNGLDEMMIEVQSTLLYYSVGVPLAARAAIFGRDLIKRDLLTYK